MCAGAMVQARVTGWCSAPWTPRPARWAASTTSSRSRGTTTGSQVTSGILADDCRRLLKTFFGALRREEA